MQLLTLLLPTLPVLVDAVNSVIDVLINHSDTPNDIALKLAAISADLKASREELRKVQLPDKQ